MTAPASIARLEAIVDRSGVAAKIEALLPVGARPRQCSVRTLLVGMLVCQADARPAHLSRVHAALVALEPAERARLGVSADWHGQSHLLTYRQVSYTFGLVADALSKDQPDGTASLALAEITDSLVEASIADTYKTASTSLAIDWSDVESWALRPHADERSADPEASWGRRKSHALVEANEVFYGWYLSAAAMVPDEAGPPLPELIRRINLTTCSVDPVPPMVPVLERLKKSGVTLGDILADSAYAHRVAPNWALALRGLGAKIVTDLHPSDRGSKGTFAGAICSNGNLYCPATPVALLGLGPLARGATLEQTAAHDTQTAEAARYKLGPITSPDSDGYQRVTCPAVAGKLRCAKRPESLRRGYDRPTVASPPEHPPACCSQKTITVPPSINAKTAQKHDYPGAAWRDSYARRSGVERAYSTLKDPASTNIDRGWCRLFGLAPILLFLTTTVAARNLRIIDAFEARMAEDAKRAADGAAARTRRRRRTSLAELAAAPGASP
jgi:hypothetical protein